ncbi:MAG: glutamine-hydrolyzing carbamoyl-phosphate synthase small subunit [Candidatus Omnitrophota bacterium]
MRATLVLEDGAVFCGNSFGSQAEVVGKVILNTAVVGYQEMMTDPANAGEILALTYPLIGNYGINPQFNESAKCWLRGLVVKESSRIHSSRLAKKSLTDFIKEESLPAVNSLDTRTLAVHLRNNGEQLGILSISESAPEELLARLKQFKLVQPKSMLSRLSVNKPVLLEANKTAKIKIAVLDLGVAASILRQLEALNASVELLPYDTAAEEILGRKPDGLIISNGPEEDVGLSKVSANISGIVGKFPILAISTGAQVLARALGAQTKSLKLGHRGVNYPVAYPGSPKAAITAQNHSLIIDEDSLARIKSIKITGYNLNDKTVEEFESKQLKFLAIQYLPSSPGLGEVNPVIEKFYKSVKGV